MKNGMSLTPFTCALKHLILEFSDSAEAFMPLAKHPFGWDDVRYWPRCFSQKMESLADSL